MALSVDIAMAGCAAIALTIFVSGGTVFEWHGWLVRAERARNPLWLLLALTLLRWTLWPDVPFLARWPLRAANERGARISRRLMEALRGLSAGRANRIVLSLMLLSAAIKIWNAWHYYGFVYGDDVEVHLMTFSKLKGHDLGVWSLRSPVFPLLFIYPVQRALSAAGIENAGLLIFAGRLVVVAFSLANIWLVYRLGASVGGGPAVGVLAAYLLAISRLHMRLGSSELPRTVSSTFLLLAFGWLTTRQSLGRTAAAGLALGVAGALRFSEIVFILPIALHLATERRYRDFIVAAAGTLIALVVLLGPGDRLFWPRMFFSLGNIVDFTLVRGESSRGFEPIAYYLFTAPWWIDPLMMLLIALGWRATSFPVRLWAVLPIVALSLFPHKEERYLLPVLPFLVIVAAVGAWRLLERAQKDTSLHAPHLFAVWVLFGVSLLELEGFRFRRSGAAVDVARDLAARQNVRNVAMEDGRTTSGATLYLLPPTEIMNIDARQLDAGRFWRILSRPEAQYVVLREASLSPLYRDLLRQAGYLRVMRGRDGAYVVFERRPK